MSKPLKPKVTGAASYRLSNSPIMGSRAVCGGVPQTLSKELIVEQSLIPFDAIAELQTLSGWMDVLWSHDPALHHHSVGVSELAACFSASLGFPSVKQRQLMRAALLHDVGKVRVPLSILIKPTSLSAEERDIMLCHAQWGYELLHESGERDDTVLTVVRDHHERLDGSGYPRGLYAAHIPPNVRIVTLCDVYMAITEVRPYGEVLSWEMALTRMFAKRTRLDMKLLKEFAKMIAAMHVSDRKWNQHWEIP
jgi:putative nucleotidyltransferase with HDIG domain